MLVAALENGTVIDHIPSANLFAVIRLLKLEQAQTAVTIGYNLKSSKMGDKSIIKVADEFFTDDMLNKLAVVAPHASLSIIKDYEVVEKREVTLPKKLVNVVQCANPVCITNNEPMPTVFRVINSANGTIKCKYCEKEQQLSNVKIVGMHYDSL